jgi:hypothetical protein
MLRKITAVGIMPVDRRSVAVSPVVIDHIYGAIDDSQANGEAGDTAAFVCGGCVRSGTDDIDTFNGGACCRLHFSGLRGDRDADANNGSDVGDG